MSTLDPKKRFSNRVEDYVKYRPEYPREIIALLEKEAGFDSQKTIADIGSGTGKLSKLFLDYGNTVFGVEPNDEMRVAAEKAFSGVERFKSVKGSAEDTTLPDHSVDCITVGQAFHWFQVEPTKKEFKRILKPGAPVVLIWNIRDTAQEVGCAYEQFLLRHSEEYSKIGLESEKRKGPTDEFFGERGFKKATFSNPQKYTFEQLQGLLDSSSYIPRPDHPTYRTMINDLKVLFNRFQRNGTIEMPFRAEVFLGSLYA